MKFSTVTFSISCRVFPDENSVGMLSTQDNATTATCDSLESIDGMLVCKRKRRFASTDPDGTVHEAGEMMIRAVPVSKIEFAEPLLNQAGDDVRRGPGRPPGSGKAPEAAA